MTAIGFQFCPDHYRRGRCQASILVSGSTYLTLLQLDMDTTVQPTIPAPCEEASRRSPQKAVCSYAADSNFTLRRHLLLGLSFSQRSYAHPRRVGWHLADQAQHGGGHRRGPAYRGGYVAVPSISYIDFS